MIDYILVEAGRLVFEIQATIYEYPDIADIWLDYEQREVVVVSSEDCLQYVMPVDEFLRVQLPGH